MAYDPATGTTKVYPIPVPHEGINSITPDESRGVAYVSTCSAPRPGPGEHAHILVLDLKTKMLERLKQTIDGKPPTKESNLANAEGHPINWDISPDGKTLYSLPM